ncbi:hypothetical protein BDF19DRAFT_428647 [Syncephalis fuscata]|nr:hypothetical protein BDF19DRAFT_428647 [Syncephalis fuscata]
MMQRLIPLTNRNIPCDLTLNNYLPLKNSNLIHQYIRSDPRVYPFLATIKYWSRRRQLIDSLEIPGVLTSYAHVMMGLQFLLMQNIVRPLQLVCGSHAPQESHWRQLIAVSPVTECMVCNARLPKTQTGQFYTYFARGWRYKMDPPNPLSTGELLIEFFRYYAFQFAYLDDYVSVRLGHPIRRDVKDWGSGRSTAARDSEGYAAGLCIEDPFELDFNLSGNANRWEVAGLRWEYERALRALLAGRGIAGACIPWTAWDASRFYDLGVYDHEIVTQTEELKW